MHIFPINTYSNFGRPSTQWPNRRAKMKNMFFLLNSGSQILLVHCYRGMGEQFHPWNRLETRTFLVDTIDTYWYHHYIVWLPNWTGPSSKRFKFYFRNSDHKMFEVWITITVPKTGIQFCFLGKHSRQLSGNNWGRCHYRTFNNDQIGRSLWPSNFSMKCARSGHATYRRLGGRKGEFWRVDG